MSESSKERAARAAAEKRADYVRALEDEKAGLKRRSTGSQDDAEKARLDDRVKQVDAEIARVKKSGPLARSTSGDSQTA